MNRTALHTHVISRPAKCDAIRTVEGWQYPCEKPAVAVALQEGMPYPVCKHHARGREMLTLAELFEALEVRG